MINADSWFGPARPIDLTTPRINSSVGARSTLRMMQVMLDKGLLKRDESVRPPVDKAELAEIRNLLKQLERGEK